jgi:hypothetical protein
VSSNERHAGSTRLKEGKGYERLAPVIFICFLDGVLFPESRYELLIEDGCLSASLVHFRPGNTIGIRMTEPAPVGRWLHVVMACDGSSRAHGLVLYVDGQRADTEVVRDNLYKNITGGSAEVTVSVKLRYWTLREFCRRGTVSARWGGRQNKALHVGTSGRLLGHCPRVGISGRHRQG